ncbi:MAG: hypothetical protein ACI84O_000478 [Myxococcota bacterium]
MFFIATTRYAVDMRSTRVVLLFLVIAMGVSCGSIPPYSSVNRQAVKGFYTLKVKSAVISTTSMRETTLSTDSYTDDVAYETSSTVIELEKILRDQVSAVFSLHKREYTIDENDPNSINGNQIHAGLRRYFGDRALTAFLAIEGIYAFNFDHPQRDLDFESGVGWALGGGLNFALNESFSIETSIFYEELSPVNSYAAGNTSLPSDYEYSFKGTMVYFGLGFHF